METAIKKVINFHGQQRAIKYSKEDEFIYILGDDDRFYEWHIGDALFNYLKREIFNINE